METLACSVISGTGEPLNRRYVWRVAMAAAMGGLLFGYDWVVISGAEVFYEKYFSIEHHPAAVAWAMSAALVGALLGAVSCGGASDKFGRKKMLILAAILFAVSSIGTGFAGSFATFVIWRIFGGVAIGMASNLSPIYIAEISPPEVRGKLVSSNQLAIAFGVVAAQVVNWLIARPTPADATALQILHSWNGQMGWRLMFAATTVPSLLFFFGMLFAPESPRWLMKQGRPAEADHILGRIGGREYADRTSAAIHASLVHEGENFNYRELLKPRMAKALTLGIVLAVFQQWCGINVIFSYASKVFKAAGYHVSGTLFNIVITGVVAFICAIMAMFVVDRLGRRIMLLGGAIGLVIVYALLGWAFHVKSHGVHMVILVALAVAVYCFTLAPVTWVVLSEIFPNRIRGAAMAVAVFALWAADFVLTFTFPFLNRSLGTARVFWMYGGICLLGAFFIYSVLPETKGKTLEQIETQLIGPELGSLSR